MPQNSIELLQKLMEKYSRVFMSFAGKQGVPYDDVEDIVMASFWSCYKWLPGKDDRARNKKGAGQDCIQ